MSIPGFGCPPSRRRISAYFAGEPYKKAVFVSVIPFTQDNMDRDKLVPFIHDDYFAKREAGAFVYDINDPSFRENPDY